MSSDDKSKSDDDDDFGGTVTRKIRTLQEMGVLDEPTDEPEAPGAAIAIKTYPFEKPKTGHYHKMLKWLKKDKPVS